MNYFSGLPSPMEIDTTEENPAMETAITGENRTEQSQIETGFYINNYYITDIIQKTYGTCNCITEIIKFLPKYSKDDINKIEMHTRGQHQNDEWKNIRHGRITASNFYPVFTKVNTIVKNVEKNIDCNFLISSILGYNSVNSNIKSLKHGRETEPETIAEYIKDYKKSHQNVLTYSCGIFIDCENCYLGASPDLIVSCSCCGEGLLEVKCPMIPPCNTCNGFCRCKLPDFLVLSEDGVFQLKKNHRYYVQVQGQLAICNRKRCDFFVYTCNNGQLDCRVNFEKDLYYNCIFPNLRKFFIEYIVPELLNPKLKDNNNAQCMDVSEPTACQSDKQRFFCPVCNFVVKEAENVKSYYDGSVGCDKCGLWYHFRCVKVKQSAVKNKEQWFCPDCVT